MEFLIARNSDILSLQQIRLLAQQWNDQHCYPPLDVKEYEKQWICALNFVTKNSTKQSGNAENIQGKQELYVDEVEKLVDAILTKNQIEFVFNTIMKEGQYDELSIKQIFYGYISAFTKIPIPHVVNSKDSGAGKSYILNLVASYFPEKYVMIFSAMSDKALYHRDGPLVIEDEKTGEIELLGPIINKLNSEIEEINEQIEDERKKDERKKDYQLIKFKRNRITEIEDEIEQIRLTENIFYSVILLI
jgi:hypothetical protein